jgi:sulfur-carrier protein
MKIKLKLFGGSREFSEKEYLELQVQKKALVKDLRNEIIRYLKKNFKGNNEFIKIVKSSAFCSENNEIISDNYKITKDQKIGIIPPIGGG